MRQISIRLLLLTLVLAIIGQTDFAMADDHNKLLDVKIQGSEAEAIFSQLTQPVAVSKDFAVNGVVLGEMRFGRDLTCTHWYQDNSFDCSFSVNNLGTVSAP